MGLANKTVMVRNRENFRSTRELQTNLLREIEACEHRAHNCGMLVTARALNRAKNALGWEIAGDIEQAAKASRDEHLNSR